MGELEEIYKEEAGKSLEAVNVSLGKLRKNSGDQKEIFSLYRAVHTLKSSSFQMGFYTVGYLSQLICEMLKEIKVREIELDEGRLAFLEDFYGTLKKAINAAFKKKEYVIQKGFFKKLNGVIQEYEKEQIGKQEKKIKAETKEFEELDKFYIETTVQLLRKVSFYLGKLKLDKSKLDQLVYIREETHKLKGNSLQAGQFLIAYMASKMHEHAEVLIKKKEVSDLDLVYFYDVFHTTEKLFHSFETGEQIFDKSLVEGFNVAVNENIFRQIEKKLQDIVKEAKKN